MKNKIIRIGLFSLFMTTLIMNADAQRTGRRRGATTPANQSSTGQDQQVNSVDKAPVKLSSGIPIERDSTGGFDTILHKSLRPDDAFDKSFISDRTPLPYENLRWDDALFSEKVWRELDFHEKMNKPFLYSAEDDNGSQMFINILLKAVRSGQVAAFSGSDDRFTTPLSAQEVQGLTAGGPVDTIPVPDPQDVTKVLKYKITQASFDPKSVMKLRIKEQWIFDREASRMFVRILGVAPLKTEYLPNGQERGSSVMFWVYYPDLRPTLAKYEVYNPKNMGYGRMTWEELFESRMFSSYVTKSTLDNPSNKNIRQMIKDPILALLEGDNIKDRIFNYEQDLWSY
jgi:gliding motility associated protien GldN